MKYTITHLKKAIHKANSKIGKDAICIDDESRPNECDNSGTITVVIDQDFKLQFGCSGATCICCTYWSDVPASRSDAIKGLIDDIEFGTEPMDEDTAWECGVDL